MRSKLDWRGWMTLALWVLLCTGCMTVMLWWAAGKSIAIADAAPNDRENADNIDEEGVERYRLTLETEEGKPRHFTIPIAPAIRADQISIENRYMERQLWIYIQGAQASDYRDYVIAGDLSPMVSGWAQQQEEMTILKLQMNTIQEYNSVMEENRLYVEYTPPDECYDRIVVIDPRYGGEDSGLAVDGRREKEINLQIAKAVRRLLEGSEVKVYLTRQEDVEVSLEDRALLVREVNADLYVGISVN
ncbi:MAG: N-acetylmuramoyl-L-alanine amidase, partial [Acetatifactor sp.]|nr:N-acetylmuramoyl-L-alanine amidase [Acetatifactor sp.]